MGENNEITFILLRKEKRSSSRDGENMTTAFKNLEGNCKMKRNIFFLACCAKQTRIQSQNC